MNLRCLLQYCVCMMPSLSRFWIGGNLVQSEQTSANKVSNWDCFSIGKLLPGKKSAMPKFGI